MSDLSSPVGTLAMMVKLSVHLTVACLIGAPLILIVAAPAGSVLRRSQGPILVRKVWEASLGCR